MLTQSRRSRPCVRTGYSRKLACWRISAQALRLQHHYALNAPVLHSLQALRDYGGLKSGMNVLIIQALEKRVRDLESE